MLSKTNVKVKPNAKKTTHEQLVNYVMLYDYGDECIDVTGGWNSDALTTIKFNGKTMSKAELLKNYQIVCI
jgi:hypothetical protein